MMNLREDNHNYSLGVISDTHGYLHESAKEAFKDVDLIIHAGDIGGEEILNDLLNIAPLVAVRGNMDHGRWAEKLPQTKEITVGNLKVVVIHDIHHLNTDLSENHDSVVVNGHTHRAAAGKSNGILFLNPGSATHPRHGFPPTVVILKIKGISIKPIFINLDENQNLGF